MRTHVLNIPLIIATFLLACGGGNRQNPVEPTFFAAVAETVEANDDVNNENFIYVEYDDVEVKPLFNGMDGMIEFYKYLEENPGLRQIYRDNDIKVGGINGQFFIDTDGSVVGASITKSPHELISDFMLRLINTFNNRGKWSPGTHDGEPVKVRMLVSVHPSGFLYLDYPYVEVKPLFNGKNSEEEFRKYFKENNKFEEIAEENGIQGMRLFYHFFIDINGNLVDATVRESSHPLFSVEILRLINTFNENGKWTPGIHNGETIKVRYVSVIHLN